MVLIAQYCTFGMPWSRAEGASKSGPRINLDVHLKLWPHTLSGCAHICRRTPKVRCHPKSKPGLRC